MDFSWEQKVAALGGREGAAKGQEGCALGGKRRHTRIFGTNLGFCVFLTPVTKIKLSSPLMKTKLSI